MKGFLVKPAILSAVEVEELREFVLRQRRTPESLPPNERGLAGGPVARLIDDPVVMDVLLDVIDRRDSGLWQSYACPPCSLVVFSGAVRHHKPTFAPEVIAGLSPEHQRFFRDVYHPQFDRGGG